MNCHNCHEEREVWVKIPADLSSIGREKWRICGIDACVAPIVAALQSAGVDMRGSCCGHGKRYGEIALQDGRCLVVLAPEEALEYQRKQSPGLCWKLHLEPCP